YSKYNFSLNLGGIANISARSGSSRIAYDTCPANMVLNLLASRKGKLYDAGGSMASKGKLLPELLTSLNQLDFYAQSAPKSLGYEWVSEKVFPLTNEQTQHSPEDLLHTFCIHIAHQITLALAPYKTDQPQRLLVTGGGAYNTFLIKLLEKELSPLGIEVVVPDNIIIEF